MDGAAWAVGALLYWDTVNSRFTTTVGSNVLAGVRGSRGQRRCHR
jgi:hypothetical protein